ncbi:hypothetical protein IMG5_023370 [Ichthyophthirius multifiliis]|uniref:Uncharacterized protein n=1 Tax=Ichthyophthirius multifiliis TaxID=5932 RepID=G0QKZ2_ICHMU|nr:hypothetical protein IMG5_023370 [Ichthyophthirius multifiliis]EGR34113.1 hypothetical protein IMG5_023370 [Ichthyophthirius multifiliis]|eukprot:XP_004039417.1 hypothetical protein IMG5_023370 [Ichthyophthirius multifiliis]
MNIDKYIEEGDNQIQNQLNSVDFIIDGSQCLELSQLANLQQQSTSKIIYRNRESRLKDMEARIKDTEMRLKMASEQIKMKLKFEDIRLNENNEYNWPCLGQLLVDFLLFYGMDDYKYKYVKPYRIESQNNVNSYIIDTSYDLLNQGKIQIFDPLYPQNNVSRSTFKYQNIKTAFAIGYSIIHQVYQCDTNFFSYFFENLYKNTIN